jgi:hypothetical protein
MHTIILSLALLALQVGADPRVPPDRVAVYEELGKLYKADQKLWFIANGMSLSEVVSAKRLGGALAVTFTFSGDVDPKQKVFIDARDVTARDVLVSLADEYNLAYVVTGADTVTIKAGAKPR